MINCVPENDDREHEHSQSCWCNPSVRWKDDDGKIYPNGPIVIHEAADQRQVVERLIGEGIAPDKKWINYVS